VNYDFAELNQTHGPVGVHRFHLYRRSGRVQGEGGRGAAGERWSQRETAGGMKRTGGARGREGGDGATLAAPSSEAENISVVRCSRLFDAVV
jgi:hypothetical protein